MKIILNIIILLVVSNFTYGMVKYEKPLIIPCSDPNDSPLINFINATNWCISEPAKEWKVPKSDRNIPNNEKHTKLLAFTYLQKSNQFDRGKEILDFIESTQKKPKKEMILAAYRTFNRSLIDKFRIISKGASIEVIGQKRNNIELKILKHPSLKINFERRITSFTINGRALSIIDDISPASSMPFRYCLFIPVENFISGFLKTTDGSISVRNCCGTYNLQSQGDLVELKNFDGNCDILFNRNALLKNISGKLNIGGTGNLQVINIDASNVNANVSGNIYAEDVTSHFSAKSYSGSICCLRSNGTFDMAASNGLITIFDTKGYINAYSANGEIDIKLNSAPIHKIIATTIYGDVSIRAPYFKHKKITARSQFGEVTIQNLTHV